MLFFLITNLLEVPLLRLLTICYNKAMSLEEHKIFSLAIGAKSSSIEVKSYTKFNCSFPVGAQDNFWLSKCMSSRSVILIRTVHQYSGSPSPRHVAELCLLTPLNPCDHEICPYTAFLGFLFFSLLCSSSVFNDGASTSLPHRIRKRLSKVCPLSLRK